MPATPIRSISPSGTCVLDDGREMQMVVATNGFIGVRPVTREDQTSGIDQEGQMPPKAHFDISGLDQS